MKPEVCLLFVLSLSAKVLGVRARYEKELRGLHEDKNRSEEEIRQQLRDEKVNGILKRENGKERK